MSVQWRLLAGCLVSLAVMSAGCEQTTDERVASVCSVICGCEAPPLPKAQELCVAGCRDDFNVNPEILNDECLACITGNADRCTTLQQVCEPICDSQPEPDPFVDAGPVPL